MPVFARIIELENGTEQVLLEKQWNDEDFVFELKISSDFDGGRAAATMGFDTEEKRDFAFDTYTVENAENIRKGMSEFYTAD